jgi:hypothetical protein
MSSNTRHHETATTAYTMIVDTLWAATSTDELVSRDRCVDDFLDLYGATANVAVRREIEGFIGRISSRSLISAPEIREVLTEIGAAAGVESAFEHLVLFTTDPSARHDQTRPLAA